MSHWAIIDKSGSISSHCVLTCIPRMNNMRVGLCYDSIISSSILPPSLSVVSDSPSAIIG